MEFFLSINKPRPLGRGGTRQGVGEGELACGIVWPFGFGAVYLRGELGLVARLWSSLFMRASSPLPPLTRSPFPQRGRLISGSCFAVAGVGALVGGQSIYVSESPLSVPLGHLSPKGETISYMYALLVFVICKGDGFFLGSCFAVAGVLGVVYASLYLRSYKKSHS